LPPLADLSPLMAKSLLGVWIAALGGAIGSFLNVVIYRLPAAMSLSSPGSHCPACKHPIRWYDNVPVLGWIGLRGRCRDCGVWISPRYPIVEAITAGLFLLVGVVEGFSGGANLPLRPEPVAGGVLLLPLDTAQLAGIVAYHLLLLATLLAAAGIEYDEHRMPVRLVLPAVAAGCLAAAVWPYLQPVPAWRGLSGLLAGPAGAALGLAAGAALGLAARPLLGPLRGPGFLLALATVGLFLGWQATLAIGVAALATHLAARMLGRLGRGAAIELPTLWLTAATLAWILAWRPIVARFPLLG
jgi:leader peptidase (prepilin peptidase)/N-methyltransferase